jgi:hypothetical protein
MLLAGELINDNGTSSVAFAFFTALLATTSATIIGIIKVRQDAKEAKDNALEASTAAKKAQTNTTNVSNGFASSVGGKLDSLIDGQIQIRRAVDDQADALRKHLEWHLTKGDMNNGNPS